MARLKRIVKLPLKQGKFHRLKEIFDNGKHVVVSSDGCFDVKLLKDRQNPNLAFTISEWVDEKALNKYRESNEFRNYWPEIKTLLKEKPEVWSLTTIDYLRSEGDAT